MASSAAPKSLFVPSIPFSFTTSFMPSILYPLEKGKTCASRKVARERKNCTSNPQKVQRPPRPAPRGRGTFGFATFATSSASPWRRRRSARSLIFFARRRYPCRVGMNNLSQFNPAALLWRPSRGPTAGSTWTLPSMATATGHRHGAVRAR
jgi:hypothetical protein